MKNIYKSWTKLNSTQNKGQKNTKPPGWLPLASNHNRLWKNEDYPNGEDWKYVRFESLNSFEFFNPEDFYQNRIYQNSRFFIIEINNFSYPTQIKTEDGSLQGFEVKTHLQEFETCPNSPLHRLFKQNSGNGLFAKSALSFMGLGLILKIKPEEKPKKPIKILFNYKNHGKAQKDNLSQKKSKIKPKENSDNPSPTLNVFNLFIDCSEKSQTEIFLDFQGKDLDGLSNFRLDINMNEKSKLNLFSKETGGAKSHFVYNLQAELKKQSQLKVFDFTFPGLWTRHNLHIDLKETKSDIHLKGGYVNDKNYFCDHHTCINHQVGETFSKENYRGILSGASQGVFNGKVYIAPSAEKSQSEQINKNLMLSKKAEVNAKPELQIYNDNVTATHGATVGQMDGQKSFYLQSRGYSYKEAVRTLSKAFMFDLMNGENPLVRDFYHHDFDSIISELVK